MIIEVYAKKTKVLPERCRSIGGAFVEACPPNIPALGKVVGRKDAEPVLADMYEIWVVAVDLPTAEPPMATEIGQGCSVPVDLPLSASCSMVVRRDDDEN